jgi:hypothetical protein
MDNPGIYSLGDVTLGAPVTGTAIGTGVSGLNGMKSAVIEASLTAIGTLGTSVNAYIKSSLDQGATYFDVACLSFGGTSQRLRIPIGPPAGAAGTATVPTSNSLTANTSINGLLGPDIQLAVSSTGTFGAGSTLSVRLNALD